MISKELLQEKLQDISIDFIKGFHRSIRYDNVCKSISRQYSLFKIFLKILFWNFMLHVSLPLTLNFIADPYYSSVILYIAYWPINLWSSFLHVVYFIELVAHIDKSKVIVEKVSVEAFGISASITMAIYYMSFGLISPLTNILINPIFSQAIWLFNFGVLALYHAFYCYNNLWQYQNVDLNKRIEQQSILWPYSLGYGCVASLLYLNSDGYYLQAVYNLHMISILIMPFVTRKPQTNSKIVLNMNIFSHVTALVLNITSVLKTLVLMLSIQANQANQVTNKTSLEQNPSENQIPKSSHNQPLN
jgi:hypothetical protein